MLRTSAVGDLDSAKVLFEGSVAKTVCFYIN